MTLKINRVTLALGLNSGAFSVGVGFSTSSGGISFGPAKASFSKKYTNKYRNFTSTVLGKMKASAEKGKTRIRKTYDLNGAK